METHEKEHTPVYYFTIWDIEEMPMQNIYWLNIIPYESNGPHDEYWHFKAVNSHFVILFH